MHPKAKKDNEPLNVSLKIELTQQADNHQKLSPGFILVAIGLVAYIFDAAKLIAWTWLHPIAIAFIVVGFVALIIETLVKIKIH